MNAYIAFNFDFTNNTHQNKCYGNEKLHIFNFKWSSYQLKFKFLSKNIKNQYIL